MREHIFFPKPLFQRNVCFPDFIGGYSHYPEHTVNREYQTKENDLDRNYNLHLIMGGKGFLYTEGKTYELTRGQGFLYGPGLRQVYRSDSTDPWDIRWIHFFGVHLEELLNGRGVGEPWLFSVSDLPSLERLMERLLQLGRSYQVDDECQAAAVLYEFLTRLQTTADQLNVPVSQAADKIRAAANYIRSHSSEPFTLKQAAALAGYSPHYFSRKFSHTFGMSFPEFLAEARLLNAKQLLIATNLSIKQIAADTGFAQSSYFVTCFRRQEGMSPGQFRSLHKV